MAIEESYDHRKRHREARSYRSGRPRAEPRARVCSLLADDDFSGARTSCGSPADSGTGLPSRLRSRAAPRLALNAYLPDIATPLGIVMGHANLLELQPDLDEELKRTARSIRDQAARVDTLVKRLRAAGDRRTVDSSAEVDVAEALYEVAEFLRPLATKRRVAIVLSLEGAAGVRGDLDPLSFSQVLQNLIVNAVQASEEGSEIRVTTSANASAVEVEVADEGSGIPDEVRHRIFEPYFTTKEEGVGTGLGLYMSRRLVGRRSGSLELVTTSPEGSVFRVTLRRRAQPR